MPPKYSDAETSVVELDSLDELFGSVSHAVRVQRTDAQIAQDVTFAYGKAVGLGVQSFLEGKNFDRVMWDMFLEWDTFLLDADERMNKSFFDAILAVRRFTTLNTLDLDIADYELVRLPDGRPAVELSFVIRLPYNARYRGYIDAVLRNKYTGEIVVLECKTTGSNYVAAAKYQNSEQALGYAIVLDRIFGKLSSYSVLYTVYLSKSGRWETFKFPKTAVQRASWFMNTITDLEHLEGYIQNQYFPTHGENCQAWNRPCEYIDNCHNDLSHFFVEDLATDKDEDFDYVITWEELAETQLNTGAA